MKTLQELKTHLEKYKDALILVGPGAVKNIASIPPKEEQIKYLNNKCLRRTSDEFWKFFFDKFYIKHDTIPSSTQRGIALLHAMSYVNKVVTLYPDGLMSYNSIIASTDVINLHGSMQTYTCQKGTCKIQYPAEYILNDDGNILTCEVCGSKLRPNVLLSGETYNDDRYQALVALLNQTHTLFTIGLDYTEEPMLDLIASYCDLKAMQNADGEEKILVGIVDSDVQMDVNTNLGLHEFLVKDDCDAAMLRLIEGLK